MPQKPKEDTLAFCYIAYSRFLYMPERKCPVEVVYREAQVLLKDFAQLIFKEQALLKGYDADGQLVIALAPYDTSIAPANQNVSKKQGMLVPERDLYDVISILVNKGVCTRKTYENGNTYLEISDEG